MLNYRDRFRSLFSFLLINSSISIIIAIRYFNFLSSEPNSLGLVYIVVATYSQMIFLTFLSGLVLVPLQLLPTSFRNIMQAALASFLLAFLIIDTFVFAQYRFHINQVVLELVMSGQVVSFSISTWLVVCGAIVALFSMQFFLLKLLDSKKISINIWFIKNFLFLFLLFGIMTNLINVWSVSNAEQSVTMVNRYLPVFHPLTARSLMTKLGLADVKALDQQKKLRIKKKNDLNYPLQKLVTEEIKNPVNIIFLVIDSWRADSFSERNTPNIWKLSQEGVIFDKHMSTGNSTRTGIFGLFYGLSGTYWHAFFANRQSPLLMDRLQELNYEIKTFTAAHLKRPEFTKTIFAHVKDIDTDGSVGNSVWERDKDINKNWGNWFNSRDKKRPFFTFFFYDGPHGYSFPTTFKEEFKPSIPINYLELNNDSDPLPRLNFYKNSVRYTDFLVGQVIDRLKESGELDNTLIVITGDHGQELNDSKKNYWGHNSNFSDAQVSVPLAIIGPRAKMMRGKLNGGLTSHEDIAPTVLKNYLGVTNPISDYSGGADLFSNGPKREWVMASSYAAYAILGIDYILEVDYLGQYKLMDKTYSITPDKKTNYVHLKDALDHISHFSK